MVKKFKLIDSMNNSQNGGNWYSSISPMIPTNMVGAIMSGEKIKGEKLTHNLSTLPVTSAMGTLPFTSSPSFLPPVLPVNSISGVSSMSNPNFPLMASSINGVSTFSSPSMMGQPMGFQVMKPSLPLITTPLNNLQGIVTPMTTGPFIKYRPPSYTQRTNISVTSPRGNLNINFDENFVKKVAASLATKEVLSPFSDSGLTEKLNSNTDTDTQTKVGIVLIVENTNDKQDYIILMKNGSAFGNLTSNSSDFQTFAKDIIKKSTSSQININIDLTNHKVDVDDPLTGKKAISYIVKIKRNINELPFTNFACIKVSEIPSKTNVSQVVKNTIVEYNKSKDKYLVNQTHSVINQKQFLLYI